MIYVLRDKDIQAYTGINVRVRAEEFYIVVEGVQERTHTPLVFIGVKQDVDFLAETIERSVSNLFDQHDTVTGFMIMNALSFWFGHEDVTLVGIIPDEE